MARLVTLADRAPTDVEWKGAVVWKTILSLAEAQHEVLALTTLDPSAIEVAHPRLTIVQPAPGFGLRYLGRWLRALLQYQPEIVHTFGLRRPGRFSSWPALAQTLMAFPGLQRYSTVFSDEDYAPFAKISAPFDAADFAVGGSESPAEFAVGSPAPFLIVPAPVSEWQKPMLDLLLLGDYLEHNSGVEAHIVGGWGPDFGLSERREGWLAFGPLSQRVRMLPDFHFQNFVGLARSSRGLWMRALRANSWRAYVSSHVAQALQLPTIGSVAQLNSGSPANFLSRLYSST